MPKCLLIYPDFPLSYWSGRYAVRFLGKKAPLPPLGLATIAAFMQDQFDLRLVDMNVDRLTDRDLDWCDYAFISGMTIQRESIQNIISRCKERKIRIAAGGPYATSFPEELKDVDHLILGEVEDFFPVFLRDLLAGNAGRIYAPAADPDNLPLRPQMAGIPVPCFNLLNIKKYASLAVQFSRGCPHNCEFCDVTKLFGRNIRTKSSLQILAELQSIYDLGFRGPIFFVDDNFIGNRRQVKALLPEIIRWQEDRNYPFTFFTEATVNLADDPALMASMAEAGFNMVFLGIETPNPEVLLRTKKAHNVKGSNPDYLMWAVRTIQQHGMEVTGGFIVGFDGDSPSCFESQLNFVQKAGIPSAMVGLLTPFKGTDLHARLKREGRLLDESAGDNVAITLRFVPQMNPELLISGYKNLLKSLYGPGLSNYFERCWILIQNWQLSGKSRRKLSWSGLRAMLLSLMLQGLSRQGPAYLKFLIRIMRTRPSLMGEAIRLAVIGYHYQKVTSYLLSLPEPEFSFIIAGSEQQKTALKAG